MKAKLTGWIVCAFCILMFLWGLIPFVTHRVLNIGNLTVMIGCGLLFLVVVFRIKIVEGLHFLWSKKPGKGILVIFFSVILAIFVLAVTATIQMVRGSSSQSLSGATVLVLGCKVNGDKPSMMLEERLVAARDYLQDHPECPCIVSGGQGTDESISEAECMSRYLVQSGIDPDRIILEDRSTSTRENLSYSLEIIREKGFSEEIMIVTNEFHQYRAGKVADALQIRHGSVPARTTWWLLPTYYVRELYGIVFEWVF